MYYIQFIGKFLFLILTTALGYSFVAIVLSLIALNKEVYFSLIFRGGYMVVGIITAAISLLVTINSHYATKKRDQQAKADEVRKG